MCLRVACHTLQFVHAQELADRGVLNLTKSRGGAFVKPTTLDDLLSLWEDQKETGTQMSPEQLCSECPELLEEFRWHVKALEAVDSNFGIVTDSRAAATPGFRADGSQSPLSVVRMSSELVVEKLQASGGLGSVYLAHDPILNRRVALKFPHQIRQSSAARARFEREAHITSQLDHPGVVPVHAISTTEGGPSCYATRFVEGQTLLDTIREFHESAAQTTGVEFRQLLQWFVTVCNIVAYAHDRSIIHRDIKPGNILLGAFGETLLIDWGLAKVIGATPGQTPPEPMFVNLDSRRPHDDITVSGQLMGTPAYASPEQIFGRTAEVAAASDVYSLGATLFTMLTGQTLFSYDEFDQHLQRLNAGIVTAPRERNAAVPEPLNAVCLKALAIDTADRYPSALALAQDIERWLADETVSVLKDPVRVRIGREIRKRPRAAAATTATILMILIAGMLGSVILGQKNRQLTSNNQLLTRAISNSELANRQTLNALRSLVDEVVVSKFGEQTELFAEELRMQERFPETAQHSTIRPRALIEYAIVLQRKAKTGQALVVLTQAALDLEEAVRRDQTEASRITMAKARIALAAALRNVQATSQARLQLATAAELAANIAEEHPSDFELLSRLAALHGELEDAFDALKLKEQSARHHLKELELRHIIVDAFPENPYYRVELIRTLVRHGRGFIPSGNFTSSEMSLAAAETALIEARRDFPNDPLIRKTQGDIDRCLGSLLFNMNRFSEALVHFDAAVKLNPCIDHVASRLRCLAEVRPGDVLEEAHRIEQGELPNGAPLKNLIIAVGVATQKTQDAEDFVSLCDVVVRLLRYMIAEDYFPQDRTIKELLTQRRFSRLRMRSGVNAFLVRLEKRNQQLSTTAWSLWTSSLPEDVRLTIDKLSWQDVHRLGAPGKLLHGILSVFMAKPADNQPGQPAVAVPPSD